MEDWFKLTDIKKQYNKKQQTFSIFIQRTIIPYAKSINAEIKYIRGGNYKHLQGTFTNDKRVVDKVKLWANPDSFLTFKRAELQFGEDIIKNLFSSYTIKTQFKCDCYRLDWYIPELNLAIEFDEPEHNCKLEEDLIRQKYIEEKLNCKFIRYTYKI